MPKTPTDYSKAIIYSIICKTDDTLLYIGSTTSFRHRKCQHKHHCINEKNKSHNFPVYVMIRANGGWDNFEMKPIKEFPCNNKTQLLIEEEKLRKEMKANLNNRKAYVTIEEHKEYKSEYTHKYRDEHNEVVKERNRKYRDEHKEERKKNNQKWHEANKEYINEYTRKYRDEHNEAVKKRDNIYREANKEKINEQRREIYKANKDKLNEKQRQYRKAKELKSSSVETPHAGLLLPLETAL